MSISRAIRFADNDGTEKSEARKEKYRNSVFVRPSIVEDNDRRRSTRVSRLFNSINIRRQRQSTIIRPVLKYHPSFRLESKNPFNPLAIGELLRKIIEIQMENRKRNFDIKSSVSLCRSLSEEILSQVKAQNYDRYRIIVSVNVGEKCHQSFRQTAVFLWDAEKDAMTSYVYDRPDIFVTATVYGIYYD